MALSRWLGGLSHLARCGECSGGSSPAYNRPADDREAIPARFSVSYVHGQRGKTVGYLATLMRAYATRYGDQLAEAIRAGTVSLRLERMATPT